jgi:hypothetical protein
MGKTYPTKVDWWLAIALTIPFIAGGFTLISGLVTGKLGLALSGAGVLVFITLLFGLLILPIRYQLADDGFRLQSGRMKLHVPYEKISSAELTSSPWSSPALSLRRIRINYQRPNGKDAWVQISPPDRAAFLAGLVAASPRHQLVDGKVVTKG